MISTGNRFRVRAVKKVAVNATKTLTASEVGKGIITSTSASAVTATLPLLTALNGSLKATKGDSYEFVIDNSAGASIVTLAVNTGITAGVAVLTGSATLTVAIGSVGFFKLYWTSNTSALLYRAL